MHQITKKIFFSFYMFLSFVIICCGCFSLYVSNNYNKFYNIPKIDNCQLDLTNYDINNRNVDYLLNGDWQFYYNQWIITDKEETCTGIINLPSHWNDTFDISPKGYASYKIIINGVSNTYLSIVLNSFRYSYRAFINGKLIATSGIMSKDKITKSSGKIDTKFPYEVNEVTNNLELVLEISYNNVGGFYSVPWLTTSSFSNNTSLLSNTITIIIMLMIGALVCLSFILFWFYKGIKKYSYSCIDDFMICFCLMLNQITSKDGSLLINKLNIFNYRFLALFSYIFLLIALIFVYKKIHVYKVHFYILTLLFSLIAIFSFTKWNIILIILLLIELFFTYFYYAFKKKYYLPFSFIILLTFIELFDYLGFFTFGSECLVSIVLFIVLLCNTFEIMKNINFLAKNNIEIKKARNKILVNQIQPHFIFNTLTSIQNLYNEDSQGATLALNEFSKHLRHQIDSLNNEFISFEEELENIEHFINLYLLSKKFHVEIIYNIENSDFCLPAFSLQPFIENCLKHANLNEKKDGEIIISAKKEKKIITINIADNGCGFDCKNISIKSTGINNCIERLKYSLNAFVDIKSTLNVGTNITIIFKEKKQ